MEERKGKKQGEREREKTDRVVLIGKSKEDVKIWSKEVSLRWLKGNLVQRQMSLSLSFSLPVPPLSIFNRGYRVSGSPLPSLIYTHNCEEEHGHGKGSSPTLSWIVAKEDQDLTHRSNFSKRNRSTNCKTC